MTPAERNAVLEEAAQKLENFRGMVFSPETQVAIQIAAGVVRALKEQEPTT